ncbi:unnamed protein product [Paramecium sonneborni]|uniref:Uncharacterized protein n=1 Tax=Paramecium sonneborni TaxID=65129 RepID=A0A8S1MXV4_9CILI|nr:unnamed protein product [Paramecium sonneborni]
MVAIAFLMLAIFQQLFTQLELFFRRGGNDLNNFFKEVDTKFDKATTCQSIQRYYRLDESDQLDWNAQLLNMLMIVISTLRKYLSNVQEQF